MPTFPTALFFDITALRENGTGVAGATVRLLNSSGTDVSASVFPGTGPFLTDSTGQFRVLSFTPLTPGVYTIQVVKQGFNTWSHITVANFNGRGVFVANLVRPEQLDDYGIDAPNSTYNSSLLPILTEIESPGTFDWEIIRCRVNQPDGYESILEAPVDAETHKATIDIRNRVRLGVRPLLVKEPAITRPDTDFSTSVQVEFTSLTDEGESDIETTAPVSLLVAATLPAAGQTDLSAYATGNTRQWMVPANPVTAFRGYYRDVMIWLPDNAATGYELTTTYYNGAGDVVSTTTNSLSSDPHVQRIRLNTDPAESVRRAVLSIKDGSTVITQPLTVLYRD